jgi:putative transposase
MTETLPTASPRIAHFFVEGQIYRERRPDAVLTLEHRIRKAYRGANKQRLRMPKRLYLRVLAVMSEHVIVISTEDPHARECFYPVEQAVQIVQTGGWLLTDVEPLPVMRISDDRLSPAQIARMEKNSDLIQPLIDMDTEALIAKARWPVVRRIAEEHKVAPAHVFRVFIRYLQGGMSKQALAGRWFRRLRGIGLGVRLNMATEAGVPRKPAGRPRLDGRKAYVVLEMDVKKIIAGSRKYFFAGSTAGKWRRAWKLTLGDLFFDLDCTAGVPSDEELARFQPGTYPSYKQFRYWAELDDEFEMLLRKLYGERKFELWLRRRRQKIAANVGGSGAVFFVDATPLNWHLVHQLTRLPLEKKAILYLVVDAFSHMIVGFYLHLGHESYDAVSLALLSAAEDKVPQCALYGRKIGPDEWVSACLPTRLAEDGAGANYKHGVLVKKGVIRGLTIVPPYRADLKGLVEAYNAAVSKKAESVPGHTNGAKERGDESPVALACMDYFESVQLIISWILQTNRRVMRDYQLSPEMIAEGLVPSPRDLWNWGLSGRGGRRKTWPKESLMRWCLPTAKARLTRDGVEFGEMLYEPIPGTLPKFQDWCAHAAENGGWNVDVSYHPASYAWFYLHDGEDLVKMQLAPRSQIYATWSVADYEGQRATAAVAMAVRESENEVRDIAHEREQQQIIENAMAKTEAARGSVAQRRRDKSDRKANLADQKQLIATQGVIPPGGGQQPAPLAQLQVEDESEIVGLMEDTS